MFRIRIYSLRIRIQGPVGQFIMDPDSSISGYGSYLSMLVAIEKNKIANHLFFNFNINVLTFCEIFPYVPLIK